MYKGKFVMLWSTDTCCDGTYHDTLEEAKNAALDTLIFWMYEGWCDPNSSADDWDYMIYNAEVYVMEYNPETSAYDIEAWYPTDTDRCEIGWLPHDENGTAWRE